MATGFSYAQLKASLWARRGGRVHAVLDGRMVPGLPGLLEPADCHGWDCLQRGAMSLEAAREAAYLVELKPTAAFSDWVLDEATQTFPGWGLVMVSMQPLLAMREHCRSLGDVLTPDGQRRPWRWYDAELLTTLLPQLTPSQQDEVFGAGQQIVLPATSGWTWLAMEQGVLAREHRPLLQPAK
jgi:hypothetical protein